MTQTCSQLTAHSGRNRFNRKGYFAQPHATAPVPSEPADHLPLIVPFFEELEAFFPLGAGDEDFLFE